MPTVLAQPMDGSRHQRWLELLAGTGAGRPEALKSLVLDFQTVFLNYLQGRHRMSEADAQDLLQDVWMHLFLRKATYDPARGTPGPWLFKIVRNKRIDAFRRVGRQPEAESTPLDATDGEVDSSGGDAPDEPDAPHQSVDAALLELMGEDSAPSLETELEAREIQRCVQAGRDAFARRNEEAADLLWARFALGWTMKEIAEYRGGKESAASTYLCDVRKRFKPYIKRCLDLISRSRKARKHGDH